MFLGLESSRDEVTGEARSAPPNSDDQKAKQSIAETLIIRIMGQLYNADGPSRIVAMVCYRMCPSAFSRCLFDPGGTRFNIG